jgi:hypothetical protein
VLSLALYIHISPIIALCAKIYDGCRIRFATESELENNEETTLGPSPRKAVKMEISLRGLRIDGDMLETCLRTDTIILVEHSAQHCEQDTVFTSQEQVQNLSY